MCISILYQEIENIYLLIFANDKNNEIVINDYENLKQNLNNNILINYNKINFDKIFDEINPRSINEKLNNYDINPTSIKEKISKQTKIILEFLEIISKSMNHSSHSNNKFEDKFINNNQEYKKFSKIFITKFQKNSQDSQNSLTYDILLKNNNTYENIIEKYIYIDLILFKNMITIVTRLVTNNPNFYNDEYLKISTKIVEARINKFIDDYNAVLKENYKNYEKCKIYYENYEKKNKMFKYFNTNEFWSYLLVYGYNCSDVL